MKKIIFTILLFSIFLILPSCAKEEFVGDDGLYAYSYSVKAYDEYAKNHVSYHVLAMYGTIDDSLEMGKGIWLYGNEIPLVIYPIWKDGKIVGSFDVINYNGQYSGSFAHGGLDELNDVIGKTDVNHPLRLYKNEEGFYLVLEEGIYEMNDNSKKINNLALQIEIFTSCVFDNSKVVNVTETIEYLPISE